MGKRIIKCTEQYNLVADDYDGMPIVFRVWKDKPIIEVRIDNNFAKANGYSSVATMFKEAEGGKEIVSQLGRVPKWLRVTEDGGFYLEQIPREQLN